MTSLLDIGDLRSKVNVRGKDVEVTGISAETFFHLLDDIPELRRLLSGGASGGPEIKPQDLLVKVPGAVSSIIAAGSNPDYYLLADDDKKKLLKVAGQLNLGEQAEFIKAIWDITFPKGVQSFLDALAELMKAGGVSGWGADTQLPEQSKPSSPEATTKSMSGE